MTEPAFPALARAVEHYTTMAIVAGDREAAEQARKELEAAKRLVDKAKIITDGYDDEDWDEFVAAIAACLPPSGGQPK